MKRSTSRRAFIKVLGASVVIPGVLTWLDGCSAPKIVGEVKLKREQPKLLTSAVKRGSGGELWRYFEGSAAPQDLKMVDSEGSEASVYELFPRYNCPFAIDRSLSLGEEGLALSIPDRTLSLVLPSDDEPMWALNMVPFGVAIDGVILDPSGPWYDGGAADPNNPFDRGCSGWEYDPIYPTVSELVGVPEQLRGHVQPGPGGRPGGAGMFHYHGAPRLMLENLRKARVASEGGLVVGYSADGYWIIDALAPAAEGGRMVYMFSGYVLRDGDRAAQEYTSPTLTPSGEADGTYVQDWVHAPERKRAELERALSERGVYWGLSAEALSSGRASFEILDRRNGLIVQGIKIAGVPEGAYVYVMTPDWPEIPRWFAHEPAESFCNVIPLSKRGALYRSCEEQGKGIHQWHGRGAY